MKQSSSIPALPPDVRAALDAPTESGHAPQPDAAALWAMLGRIEPAPTGIDAADVDVDAAWARLQRARAPRSAGQSPRAPDAGVARAPDRSARRHRALPRALARALPALALALLALVAGLWFATGTATHTAPAGQTLAIALPDGSQVELAPGSRASWPRAMGHLGIQRHVRLDGQAFFDVAHAAAAPFVVETAHARVVVLGTRFAVESTAGRWGDTRVTLAEGRVRVEGARGEPVVLAQPSLQTRVGPGAAPEAPAPASLAHAVLWQDGGFAAVDQPIAAVFALVGRRYGVDVHVPDAEALARPLTLIRPRAESAEAIIRDICLAHGLDYRSVRGGFEILVRP